MELFQTKEDWLNLLIKPKTELKKIQTPYLWSRNGAKIGYEHGYMGMNMKVNIQPASTKVTNIESVSS